MSLTLRLSILWCILICIFRLSLVSNSLLFSLTFGQLSKKCIQLIIWNKKNFFFKLELCGLYRITMVLFIFQLHQNNATLQGFLRSFSFGYIGFEVSEARIRYLEIVFGSTLCFIYFFLRWAPFDSNIFYAAKSLCHALLTY